MGGVELGVGGVCTGVGCEPRARTLARGASVHPGKGQRPAVSPLKPVPGDIPGQVSSEPHCLGLRSTWWPCGLALLPESITLASHLQNGTEAHSTPGVRGIQCAAHALGCSPLLQDQGLGCPLKRLGVNDWNGACDCFRPFSSGLFPSGGEHVTQGTEDKVCRWLCLCLALSLDLPLRRQVSPGVLGARPQGPWHQMMFS